jgi:hypothetical protein
VIMLTWWDLGPLVPRLDSYISQYFRGMLLTLSNLFKILPSMASQASFHPFLSLPRELCYKVWENTPGPRYIQLIVSHTQKDAQNTSDLSVSNVSFSSMWEHSSLLPIAVRVRRESGI